MFRRGRIFLLWFLFLCEATLTLASIPTDSPITPAIKNASSFNTYDAETQSVESQIACEAQEAVFTFVCDDVRAFVISQANYTYDALGNPPIHINQVKEEHRYEGSAPSRIGVMYSLRARYYKPETGRFWTMDTYQGNREEPLSLRKFVMLMKPVCNIDPSGHYVYVRTRRLDINYARHFPNEAIHMYLLRAKLTS